MTQFALPVLSSDDGLRRYLQEIQKFPMLDAEEEFMLAKRWQEHGDLAAAHRLTTSHLRLVAKIAMGYRGYGLPVGELIAEGNIGMMQAVKRFDPDKGFRLSTYAMWWIKAAIQEYVLRSWSMVKVGTSAAHKRLFFNLRKLKRRLDDYRDGALSPQHISKIATELDVSEADVRDMDMRMSAVDTSLNNPVGDEGDAEWIDQLAEPGANQEEMLGDAQEAAIRSDRLALALSKLNPREQHIIRERRLKETPATLEDLSKEYNVSRERVRQIEARALEKLQKEMTESAA